jgi:hypothetical protein
MKVKTIRQYYISPFYVDFMDYEFIINFRNIFLYKVTHFEHKVIFLNKYLTQMLY